MINFPPLQSSRLDVQLRELTAAEAVALAATPLDKHESAIAALLRSVVQEARGEHASPGRWTVQERMLVVAHYIACTSEEGGNFSLGDGQFLDYLDAKADAVLLQVEAGQACGDTWVVRQLTGDEATVLEGLCSSRFDWVAADMAARLRAVGNAGDDAAPDASTHPGLYGTWLTARKATMGELPETDFNDLYRLYLAGLDRLHHLFALDFDAAGHLVLPAPHTTEAGGQQLAPVRFSVASAISEVAFSLCERPAEPSGLS